MKLRVINGAVIHVKNYFLRPVKDSRRSGKTFQRWTTLQAAENLRLRTQISQVVLKTSTLIVKVRKLDASIRYYDTKGPTLPPLGKWLVEKYLRKRIFPHRPAWSLVEKT